MRKPEHDDLIGLIRSGIECGATQSRGSPLPEWQDFDAFVISLDSFLMPPGIPLSLRTLQTMVPGGAGDSAHQTIINVDSRIKYRCRPSTA